MSKRTRNDGGADGRNPPEATKFIKGKSGNPSGRPPGTLGKSTIVKRVLTAKITVLQNGKKIRITKYEAALTQQVNKAAAGDTKAFIVITDLAMKHGLIGPEVASEAIPLTPDDERVIAAIAARIRGHDANLGDDQ